MLQVLDVLAFCASEGIPKALVTAAVLGSAHLGSGDWMGIGGAEEAATAAPATAKAAAASGEAEAAAEGVAAARALASRARAAASVLVCEHPYAVACGAVTVGAAALHALLAPRQRKRALLCAGVATAAAAAIYLALLPVESFASPMPDDSSEAASSTDPATGPPPPSASDPRLSALSHQPSAVSHQQSALSHQPSALSPQQSAKPAACPPPPLLLAPDAEARYSSTEASEAQVTSDKWPSITIHGLP